MLIEFNLFQVVLDLVLCSNVFMRQPLLFALHYLSESRATDDMVTSGVYDEMDGYKGEREVPLRVLPLSHPPSHLDVVLQQFDAVDDFIGGGSHNVCPQILFFLGSCRHFNIFQFCLKIGHDVDGFCFFVLLFPWWFVISIAEVIASMEIIAAMNTVGERERERGCVYVCKV